MQITNAASSIITKLGSINRDVNYAQVSWNSIQSMPYSSSGCVLLFIICLCCATESQWDQNGTKKNVRVFPPWEFLLKSAYLHCTHIHTALMGNLNATSTALHYCLKYQCISEGMFQRLQPRPRFKPTPSLPAVLCLQPWPALLPECPGAV